MYVKDSTWQHECVNEKGCINKFHANMIYTRHILCSVYRSIFLPFRKDCRVKTFSRGANNKCSILKRDSHFLWQRLKILTIFFPSWNIKSLIRSCINVIGFRQFLSTFPKRMKCLLTLRKLSLPFICKLSGIQFMSPTVILWRGHENGINI